MPSLLHAPGVDADRRADLVAGGGEFGAAQKAGAPRRADPVGGQARLAVRRGQMNVAAKADDVAETEAVEEFEQLDIAEAAIGQDRHRHALGQHLLQAGQAEVFEVVAPVLPNSIRSIDLRMSPRPADLSPRHAVESPIQAFSSCSNEGIREPPGPIVRLDRMWLFRVRLFLGNRAWPHAAFPDQNFDWVSLSCN